MQLGTRWPVGGQPPRNLPEVVVDAVRGVEEELVADEVSTAGWAWTLTWLEGLPIVELDDGTLVTYDAQRDTATVRQSGDEDTDDDDY
ncbi:hypothetical protein SAMN04489806_2733 [Paramicrobacterium humi]|uniref:Fe-S oxidoreductase n=1 Tax=Paramicrobacterium humi TaxID=640635 RepID=A0A1H4Q7E9_9MICO|nr:hypothetical protein [Microbacterium humi]SEC15458.1 hypothetical protein SAMN04489806_2733 [Microbacterium humi]